MHPRTVPGYSPCVDGIEGALDPSVLLGASRLPGGGEGRAMAGWVVSGIV